MDKQIAKNEGAFVELLNQEMKELQESQKQIDEMEKVIFERGVALESIDFIHGTEGSDHFKRIAIALYNAGCRKIPENAVVLTGEEYSDYLVMKDAHQNAIERCEKLQADNERLYKNIGKCKDAVRKETTEKFAERLKEKFAYDIERCKAVDEICKEITEVE